ncbi:hypothetical protein BV25DRAFT_1817775 [Artomyces pyxidatus]|uniref:Uncharacterized protein n=1 Tax=Artomyces pyxidatus TaxID=48021 RepID=A0ACB8TK92_9AGAM|nr:hypothetical protein BV25DRAFT_1817775 [Artomyces pyxidatus]
MYSVEEFMVRAPAEARTEDVLSNEHQLMLNRLSFELVERQRLDKKLKELAAAKEELLKEGRTKAARVDSVKAQIDMLMKTAAEISKKVDELVPAPSRVATPVDS